MIRFTQRHGALARTAAISTALLTFAAATPVAAATVAFTNVTGSWSNIIGGSNTSTTGNGTSNAQVRWGDSNGYSGYNFNGTNIGPVNVTPPGSSGFVTLGTFEHVNFPITAGTSITGVTLTFSADVLVNGSSVGIKTFNYNFTHQETPNSDNPCADGGVNGAPGVNVAGCADRVVMNFNSISDSFMIGTEAYTLDIAGFLVGGNPTNGFWTQESATNTAIIRGKVDLFSKAAGVPEPATWAMMIIGFGAVGTMVRTQRRRAALA